MGAKTELKSLQKGNSMSFFNFISDNYALSHCVLPKNKKPSNDSLNKEEMERLKNLMNEKDYYEINSIIKERYTK